MRHIIFEQDDNVLPDTAILIKAECFNKTSLQTNYVYPLTQMGIDKRKLIGFDLQYNDNNKAPAGMRKDYVNGLLKALDSLAITTLLVADSEYFKTLAGVTKIGSSHGYVTPCAIEGYEHIKVILSVNYKGMLYDPSVESKLEMSLETLAKHKGGTLKKLGSGVVHSGKYCETVTQIVGELDKLHKYPTIVLDVETRSKKFYEAGIETVGFAWNEHNGIAFPVDRGFKDDPDKNAVRPRTNMGKRDRQAIRAALKKFLSTYEGTIIYHNGTFDIAVLCYELWANSSIDNYPGYLDGLDVLCSKVHDSMLVTYLADNSCAGNTLDLKSNTHSYLGAYAIEITDTTIHPLHTLLEYNLKDSLGTFWLMKQKWPKLVANGVKDLYNNHIIPYLKVILATIYNGMPLDMNEVKRADKELNNILTGYNDDILRSPLVKDFTKVLREKAAEHYNATHKVKQKTAADFKDLFFNPGSPKQKQMFLFEHLGLPVVGRTKTKQPSTDKAAMEKLVHRARTPDEKKLLEDFREWTKVQKIITTFIKAMYENSVLHADGYYYLHGSFKIGGTVSGRLSSAAPNMQQIPSTSFYAKIIKRCFVSPKGQLFVGADFSSLEDRISALQTKDPEKLKVYLDGFDGHCLRAYAYFKEDMPDIDPSSVASINSIKKKYPELRQKSKTVTFALTYGGTYIALMNQCGMSKAEAQRIYDRYHELYKVSDQWVRDKILQASQDGYITVALGLRIHTPILGRTVLGSDYTPYEAESEARTAGNALGQGYGMLNDRANIAFMDKVWKSPYRTLIKPIAPIHDANYFLTPNNLKAVKYVNDNYVPEMEWQEVDEIRHPEVGLGGDLEIFPVAWSHGLEIPNGASETEIKQLAQNYKYGT